MFSRMNTFHVSSQNQKLLKIKLQNITFEESKTNLHTVLPS
ncbi:unnamed protein product [Acanthoscelides obtectus]|uniref:Uncharacterized protein n=1 Tax=Acanthoscelides obtectus TaxID=200917 RepID=A0A9P0KCP4_ACAOB|nr:unnamed protein product [Acanthoscelides obtectus]CAK1679993.1 hypothetical protein AOBTE_LOCUS32481 [Acanthoscelides obtectus]